MLSFIRFVSVILIFAINLQAQYGDDRHRRISLLDANNIQTIFSNTGIFSNHQLFRGTWKGTHNSYFGDNSILIGVQLPIKDYNNDGSLDTLTPVIITPVSRPGGGNFPTGGGNHWGFEPVPGFFNLLNPDTLRQIALSNYPITWPNRWPDQPTWGSNVWNGLFGPNAFVGKQEAYFVIDDSRDEDMFRRFGFLPDSTNPTRKGYGIRVSVRYVQLDKPLFKDILFRIYDIKNESLFNYSKVVFGKLCGTYIGGYGDEWNDEASLFYPKDNIIITQDFEPSMNGAPLVRTSANDRWRGRVGKFAEGFLQAPNQNRIASYVNFVPANNIRLSDERDLWRRLTPGFFYFPSSVNYSFDSIPIAQRGEDGDYMFGSHYFSLASGETRRIATFLTFGDNRYENLINAKNAEALYHSNFDTVLVTTAITLTNPNFYKTLTGVETIRWSSRVTAGTVEIMFSPDAGETWKIIEKNAPNSGVYQLNTTLLEDCSFGLLRLYKKDSNGNIYGFSQSRYFKINNPGNGSPFVKILNEEFANGIVITTPTQPFRLLVGDPESTQLNLRFYYSLFDDTSFVFTQSMTIQSDSASQIFNLNLLPIPNSQRLIIKVEVSDGQFNHFDLTDRFEKNNARQVVTTSNVHFINRFAEVPVQIRIIDSTQFTSSEYIITFNDTLDLAKKYFSVFKRATNSYLLRLSRLVPFSESEVFDGMTLYTEDIFTQVDTARSHWNINRPNNLNFSWMRYSSFTVTGLTPPFDYALVFSNSYSDSSNNLNHLLGYNFPISTRLNFRIFDITNKTAPKRVKFSFFEEDYTKRDTLSNFDVIVLSNPNGTLISYLLYFVGENSFIPSAGDTLFIRTMKGLSIFDSIRVAGLSVGINPESNTIVNFNLFQNFPNPFNPVTNIKYAIPEESVVTIKIYDIMGQKIKVLVDEIHSPGYYLKAFDGSRLASGIYFYHISATALHSNKEYFSTKKMILLK
ncbi:MAG: hypothetical protein C0425_09780 [Chlorobiaceae bacterium]|nr:hypothetical protein [Chlorobiaceae bacterium]MBA4310607.1 hypothetical protein [Chlorobiaceae bacterium]